MAVIMVRASTVTTGDTMSLAHRVFTVDAVTPVPDVAEAHGFSVNPDYAESLMFSLSREAGDAMAVVEITRDPKAIVSLIVPDDADLWPYQY